ncbi:MAG TPA: M1 family peptidase, partial [Mucilaginibacter sp.]|nr:M1 family peptidase [Mucilaginibacter sp.]
MKKVYLCTLFLFLLISLSSNAQVPGSIIDVQHYSFAIRLNDKNDIIEGKADIAVKFLQKANSFHLDLVKKNATGKGMLVSSVTEKGNPIQFQQISDTLNIIASVSEGSRHTYRVTYHGTPADGLIISTNKFGHRTFFGDNWPNRAHNWLPCVDNIADKATVDFVVTAPAHY